MKYALYTKRSIGGRPETKIAESEELAFSGDSISSQSIWEEASVDNVDIDAGVYWIIKGGDSTGAQYDASTLAYDNNYVGDAQGGYEDGYSYASLWPTTWVDNAGYWGLQTSIQYSIYATYTASGGSPSTCNYSGTGDWNVIYSDNCYVTSETYVKGDCNIMYDGAGSFNLQATLICDELNVGAGASISAENSTAQIEIY